MNGSHVLRTAMSLLLVSACRIEQRTPRPAASVSPPGTGQVLRIPPDSEIPGGPLGAAIRRGRALLAHTRDSLPRHVGNDLRCLSCHLRDGTQPGALPLVGVHSRYPQYRSRNGLVNLLEDRINDCFERSMNGTALPRDGPDMRALLAYFAFISRGVPPPGELLGLGTGPVKGERGDSGQGRALFVATCVRCHGEQGEGTALAPPLWGPRSFNIGAGMARLRTAAGFIRENMPNDRAVVLTDQQALDLAAYLVSRPRPDFVRKSDDWPAGNPPPDAAYPTRAAPRKP